jgi:hypothetical protein
MWKWFVSIAVVLIVASLVVTGKYESACEAQKRQDEKNSASIPIPFIQEENNNPKDYAQECKEEAPWWEKLVAWPDGVTALALILTLAAIAAQASLMKEHAGAFEEVAEAAKNNANSAMAGQRAYVATTCYWEVDKLRNTNARFGVILRNVGHLPTTKMRNFIDYQVVEGDVPVTAAIEGTGSQMSSWPSGVCFR